MNYVAFVPKYHHVPDELIAVLVPTGMVTREIWEDALALRIESLALAEDFPNQASILACKFLGCSESDDPRELSVNVFLNNSLFKAQLKLEGIGNEHFPVFVEENDESALSILENDSLSRWLAYARSFIDKNKDALLAYTSGSSYQREELERLLPHLIDLKIRPYADFIKKKFNTHFDYQSSDANEFEVFLNLYDFNFSISHHHDCVRLTMVKVMNNQEGNIDLLKFKKDVSKFNRNHASKVSFTHAEFKKFFFKKIYKLDCCFFDLEFPLSNSINEIEKTFFTFFRDLMDLLTDKSFSLPSPAYLGNGKNTKNFVEYLDNEIKTSSEQKNK